MRETSDPVQSSAGLPAGSVLESRFVIGEVLGRGGFAFAYRALDLEQGDACVVKELAPTSAPRDSDGTVRLDALGSDRADRLRKRFLEEASTLATLRGIGLLQMRASFRANGTAYYVTQFVEHSESLQQLLDRERRLAPDAAMDIAFQLMETLDVLHSRGLVHRDVKPSNVLVDDRGRCTIIDFGAAREWASDPGSPHTVLFTPGYAPLEQLSEHGRRGPATDVYGLCATLYHMLTGTPPPDAADRVGGVPLDPPAARCPGLEPSVSRAIQAGLALRYEDRPADVAELGALFAIDSDAPLPHTVEAYDDRRHRLNGFRFERNACPSCGGPLDHPRPARSNTCPTCREGRIQMRDLPGNRCPSCQTGVLHTIDNRGPLAICPACAVGRLERPRKGPHSCPSCGAEYDVAYGGATLRRGGRDERLSFGEWLERCGRSHEVALCDACEAQYDALEDGRWRQVVPPPADWRVLFPDQWARVAAGLAPDAGNAECERCGADYFVERDSTTLLGSPSDPFGFAARHLGRRLEPVSVAWMAAGKESCHPGPACPACATEFDRDGDYLRLVRTGHPVLGSRVGTPLSLEDWHRVAQDLPTIAEEPLFEVAFDEALERAFARGELPFDSGEPHLLWRSHAIRLIETDQGWEDNGEGTLTITTEEIAFGSMLRKSKAPFDALIEVGLDEGALRLVFASRSEPAVYDVEEVELTTRPVSGRRTIRVGAPELAHRLRVERGLESIQSK